MPRMSVADNLALRSFDRPPIAKFGFLLDHSAIREAAQESVQRFSIRTASILSPIRNLSGGNVQRSVLARDDEALALFDDVARDMAGSADVGM